MVEKDSTLLGHDIPMMSWQDGGFELPNLCRIFIIIILISILFTSFSQLAHPKILCFVMAIVFHYFSHIHIYNGRVQILVEKDSTLLGHDIPMMSWQDGRFELPNLCRIFIITILIIISFY